MTAIVEDVQSQGIDSSIVILYDLEYADGSFAYFFPDGLDSDLTQIQFRDSSGTARTYTAIPAEAEDFEITSDGAPNYRILVKAPNYKQAEEELKSAVDMVLNILKKEGGIGSFERT